MHSPAKGRLFRVKAGFLHEKSSNKNFCHFLYLKVALLLVTFHQTICCEHSLVSISLGKEVIQPQVPLRLPCYDFTPVMNHKVVSALPKVKLPTSFATHSHGVTGGVYKARERIHRSILIYDY